MTFGMSNIVPSSIIRKVRVILNVSMVLVYHLVSFLENKYLCTSMVPAPSRPHGYRVTRGQGRRNFSHGIMVDQCQNGHRARPYNIIIINTYYNTSPTVAFRTHSFMIPNLTHIDLTHFEITPGYQSFYRTPINHYKSIDTPARY